MLISEVFHRNPPKINNDEWPDLKNFWFVQGEYLHRIEHNKIVDRDPGKPGIYHNPTLTQLILGGFIKREREEREKAGLTVRKSSSDSESKKIFSFHGVEPNKQINQKVRRCFGYTSKGERDVIVKLIQPHIKTKIVKTWEEVINEM